VHEPSKKKSEYSKDNFYEVFKRFSVIFPSTIQKFHQEILMKKWRNNIFNPAIRNESLNQDGNDKDVRIVNFVTSKNLC